MANKQIYTTHDYTQFGLLLGNRDITKARVKKIIKSIKKIGWITNPIIVNEKMEIIDGQGRFMALKELDMPIEYIIHPGIGIHECTEMNINMTNWSVDDYVKSYADQGGKAYEYALSLSKAYPDLSLQMILAVMCSGGKRTDLHGSSKDDVKNGVLDINDIDKNRTVEILDFCSSIFNYVALIKGRKFLLMNAAIFVYDHPACNRDRLLYAFEKNYKKAKACTKAEDCIEQIEIMYNYHLKANGPISQLFVLSDFKKNKRNTDI